MKQISKIFFGLLFVSGLFLALPNQMFASAIVDIPVDDGGGGGGGGGGGTTTPTANATIPTATTAFNITANLDKPSYNAGDSITLTSLVSLGTCLNSASNFLVTGTIVDSGNSPTTISDFTNPAPNDPNSKLYGNGAGNYSSFNSTLPGSASFKAPSVAGNYIIRISTTYTYLPAKLIIKNINGLGYLYDMNNNIYYATNLPVHLFGTPNNQALLISTDNSGKVLTIKGEYGGETFYSVEGSASSSFDGVAFTDIVNETRTFSMDVPFTVIAPLVPTVTVYVNDSTTDFSLLKDVAVNAGVRVKWEPKNAKSCTCTTSASYIDSTGIQQTSCGTGIGIIVDGKTPSGSNIFKIPNTTTFSVTCNNN